MPEITVREEPLALQVHKDDVKTASPILSDAHEVARQLDHAKGKTVFSGIAALMRLRYEAWLEERMRVAITRQLEIREKLAERQNQTVKAENSLKTSIYAGQTADQKHLAELNQARKQRLFTDLETYVAKSQVMQGDLPTEVHELSASPTASAVVHTHISDEQIEALALRAVMNLGTEGSQDDQWEEYRRQLYNQLPSNIAQEVERRIQTMRSVLR